MRANYHTHTRRCGHAADAPETDYAERALEGGLEILGFSDHTPYLYDKPGRHPNVRMEPEQLADYVETVAALREKYAGRLDIRLGVEAEYYPALFPKLLDFLRAHGIEYLLLAQHYLGDEVGEPYSGAATEDKRILDRYVGQCIEGMQTGAFTYFAHPDLIHFVGGAAEYERQMRRLCRAAKDAGLPLEINMLGLREGRNYPKESFWRIAGEEGCAAIIGCDAHRPVDVWDPETEARARRLAEKYGLPLLETLEPRGSCSPANS